MAVEPQTVAEIPADTVVPEKVLETPEPEQPQEPAESFDDPSLVEETPDEGNTDEGKPEDAVAPVADGKPGTKAEVQPQVAVSLDPELLLTAGALGISKEEALAFKDSASLRAAVAMVEGRMAKMAPQVQQPAPVVEPQFVPQLSDDIDPEIKNAVGAMNTHYAQKISGLNQQLSSVQQIVNGLVGHYQQRQAQEFKSWVDKKTEALPAEYRELVAKSGVGAVVKWMDDFAHMDKSAGRPPSSNEELWDKAIKIAFGDQAVSIARKQITSTVQKRGKSIISRPTARTGTDGMSPEQRAVRAVAAKLKELGEDGNNPEF
jgi:hypothetical protein